MIAIIDYEAGNLTSVERAVRHLGADCAVTQDLETIAAADRIIFPGVGAAGSAMASLRRLGLDKALTLAVDQGRPVLGICLGCQIIFQSSEEDSADCLGLMPGRTVHFADGLFDEDRRPIKIPHMGWNGLQIVRPHPVLAGLPDQAEFYFVHSYHPAPASQDDVICRTSYGYSFASAMARGSLVTMQFHPEKSGRPGLRILENFIRWDGKEAVDAV